MDRIRYGIIGAGMVACGHHGCIHAIPDIDLVAVADPCEKSVNVFQHCMNDPGILQEARTRGIGLVGRYRELETTPVPAVDPSVEFLSDYRELLALEEVDAVVVATPNHTHVDIVSDCLAAGKHVLCEKPACTSLEQLKKLEEAVESSDRIYQVGLECRYLPVFREMRRMIQGNAVGQPRMTWCMQFRGPFAEKRGNWIMFQEKTGGVFVEKTCHYFDLMTWLVDSTPKSVSAVAGQDVIKEIYGVKPDIFDNGWVMIDYENGARGMLGLCMFGGGRKPVSVSVIGDEGQVEGYYQSQKIEYSKRGEPTAEIDTGKDNDYAHLSHGGGIYFEHQAFIDNIRNNRTPLTDIRAARWSTLVGLAAEESARNGSSPVTF
jgi:myo-inositol 2-dehydrogenase / D-chiro-inositol 1-dehydrogenase